ncbi:hypothetical protein D9613_011985 [Agrocybe pediades]|uniref:Nephrocystin 3-like N-terminal domain-containing protein n=1 Tax=Agrocybe pediades TaxID=84607 RepID=A0A8H4QEP9_9AGAR|nr:hypothetical protein D9613_011985 [Agrocybe pediades]
MWLNGAAGCVKSAISQSTIELCLQRGLLLDGFFFSRADPSRHHAGFLIATMSYQLYCEFPETTVQAEILSTIRKDQLTFKRTIERQFTFAIVQPLWTYLSSDQFIRQHTSFIDMIDGSDNRELDLLDIHIRLSLDLDDGSEADSTIRLYLCESFAQIQDDFDNRTSGRKLDPSWPGTEVIDGLVRNSSGQFIYAASVIRYVESTYHQPDHYLDIVLSLRPHDGHSLFVPLSTLHHDVCSKSDIKGHRPFYTYFAQVPTSTPCCPLGYCLSWLGNIMGLGHDAIRAAETKIPRLPEELTMHIFLEDLSNREEISGIYFSARPRSDVMKLLEGQSNMETSLVVHKRALDVDLYLIKRLFFHAELKSRDADGLEDALWFLPRILPYTRSLKLDLSNCDADISSEKYTRVVELLDHFARNAHSLVELIGIHLCYSIRTPLAPYFTYLWIRLTSFPKICEINWNFKCISSLMLHRTLLDGKASL